MIRSGDLSMKNRSFFVLTGRTDVSLCVCFLINANF